MNIGLEFGMNMGLEQKLSPQMIQSLQLLQMNSLELEMAVKQELETNPLLEAVEEGEEEEGVLDASPDAEPPESGDAPGEAEQGMADTGIPNGEDSFDPGAADPPAESPQTANDEIDWESYLEDGFDPAEGTREEREAPDERFERTPVYDQSLQDHLLE